MPMSIKFTARQRSTIALISRRFFSLTLGIHLRLGFSLTFYVFQTAVNPLALFWNPLSNEFCCLLLHQMTQLNQDVFSCPFLSYNAAFFLRTTRRLTRNPVNDRWTWRNVSSDSNRVTASMVHENEVK